MKTRSRTNNRLLTINPPKPGAGTSGADSHQSPDYTVTKTHFDGGKTFPNIEVAVIFWGKYWSNTAPAPKITSDTYYQAFIGIVTGPYLTGLRQYGSGPGTILGKWINDSTDPKNNYSDSDVVDMLTKFLDDNPSVPAPANGHNRFYAVVSPPGLNNALTDFGQHQDFTYKGVSSTYCWINDEGTLTDSGSTGVVNTFSHELAETCSDPFLDAWHVDGTGVSNDEIGDTCNNEFAIVQINGLKINVQCYWSAADNACILPQGTLSFLINKNTFGLDEVKEAIKTGKGVFISAFWLALDGYSIDTFKSFQVTVPTPTGPFASLVGVTISHTPKNPGDPAPSTPIPVYENPNDSATIQRIRFSYDVTFASPLSTPFPVSATDYALTATFQTGGVTVPAPNSQDTVNFELVPGADPYFSNIDTTDNSAVAWLSQDLRVCTVTKGASALPGDGSAPVFQNSQTPYDYIQQVIGYLNGSDTYTVPVPATSPDPLNKLEGQSGYETGDSSVTPLDPSKKQNYNFAIARVRMTSDTQGDPGKAEKVRVFFRLWIAPSCDTDFDPSTTYLSTPAYPALPAAPLPSSASLPHDPTGQAIQTQPFFATDKAGTHDYDGTVANANIRTLEIPVQPGRDSVWAYYGCFLDVYDASNQAHYSGTHHCLVAQIAYDNAPLFYQTGAATNPGNTDKLAQRNLQITLSGNPGPKPTHRIPQAFDSRPSPAFEDPRGQLTGLPDELMIDWGDTPAGSVAHIYWPDVAANDVLALATRLYGAHPLMATDANTVSCPVTKGVTYIPIPSAAGKTFAGLFTVDLPLGVKKGQVFDVLVRRLATQIVPPPVTINKGPATGSPPAAPPPGTPQPALQWRYVTGAFQIKIPVTTESALLGPEENTLAILKARLAAMPLQYRWRPVMQRYIEYVSARVDGSGGNAAGVPPSLLGAQPPKGGGHGRDHDHDHDHDDHGHAHRRDENLDEFEGKIVGLVFDRFGDFEGFLLGVEDGERIFYSRERNMEDLAERAWRQRLRVAVIADEDEPQRALTLILREPPALLDE
jgi:hypothetical protein